MKRCKSCNEIFYGDGEYCIWCSMKRWAKEYINQRKLLASAKLSD